MTKWVALLLALVIAPVSAAPYFRPIDFAHPQPIVGALVDPTDLGQSSAASLLPIFTHSPKDGCQLPSIVCEDWTPLAIGAAINAGKVTFDVAPLANVLPWMANAGRAIIASGWTSLRSILNYNSLGDPITFSAGPVWEYSQLRNKGSFKLFTGLALHF